MGDQDTGSELEPQAVLDLLMSLSKHCACANTGGDWSASHAAAALSWASVNEAWCLHFFMEALREQDLNL